MLFAIKKDYAKLRRALSVWILILLLGLLTGLTLLSVKDRLGIEKLMVKKIRWLTDPGQSSFQHRFLMLEACLEMFKDKPFTGHGFSNFPSLYMYYEGRVKMEKPNEYKGVGGVTFTHHPHNEIALIVAESGILGIIGILVFLYGIIKYCRKIGFRRACAYGSLLTPIFVHMMFEFPLHLSTPHYLVFILISALATSHFLKKTELHLSNPVRFGIVAFFVAGFVVFSIFALKTFVAYNRLVIWQIEYTEGREARIENLISGAENFYLRTWVMPIYMFYKAELALRDVEKNRAFLMEFVEWAEREKRRLPTMYVFYYDALVLYTLGKQFQEVGFLDEAVRSVDAGTRLYPENEELKKLRRTILVDTLRTIFKNLGIKKQEEQKGP